MLEIKEEDIDANQYDDEYYNTEPFVVITPKRNHEPLDCKDEFCKHDEQLRNQLKQQILQNQEDAKNLREDRDILLKENNELGSQLQDTAKDRLIIERLKVKLSKCVVSPQEIFDKKEYSFRMVKQILKDEFQEILERKKK